jgi:hypothetical protein
MTQDLLADIQALDTETARLVLERLVFRLRDSLDADAKSAVQGEADARDLVRASTGHLELEAGNPPAGQSDPVRDLLRYAAEDEATAEALAEILAHPPSDRQMVADAVLSDPFVLGALVTLLQTRFRIRVKSTGEGKSYEFEVGKAATSTSGILSLLKRFGTPP